MWWVYYLYEYIKVYKIHFRQTYKQLPSQVYSIIEVFSKAISSNCKYLSFYIEVLCNIKKYQLNKALELLYTVQPTLQKAILKQYTLGIIGLNNIDVCPGRLILC